MTDPRFTERDWKLFREKIPSWQEAYMDRLNREYIQLLSSNADASEKFWSLNKRIQEDRKSPGVHLEMKRSSFIYAMIDLLNDGVITPDDLSEFSDVLKEALHFIAGI